MTQEELATRLGFPQSFVSKYETGERRLDVMEFADVCIAIGLDPTEFLREMLLLNAKPTVRRNLKQHSADG